MLGAFVENRSKRGGKNWKRSSWIRRGCWTTIPAAAEKKRKRGTHGYRMHIRERHTAPLSSVTWLLWTTEVSWLLCCASEWAHVDPVKDQDLFDVVCIRRMKSADANSNLINTPQGYSRDKGRVKGRQLIRCSINRVSCVISNCFVSPSLRPRWSSPSLSNLNDLSWSFNPDLQYCSQQASLGSRSFKKSLLACSVRVPDEWRSD